MDAKLKKEIAEALEKYGKDKGLSQDQLAQVTGLNIRYINAILSGELKVGTTFIKEAHWTRIAKMVGVKLEKDFVGHIDTPQYNQIYTELLDAKLGGRVKIIISKTGYGKTYAVNRFLKEHPSQSYKITLSSLYHLPDVLEELCSLLNVDKTTIYTHQTRLKHMSYRLRYKKNNGDYPILVFDEAENATVAILRLLKALYDEVYEFCPIVLIGTPELLIKLEKLKKKGMGGISQFYRRFKAGVREISDINKEIQFIPFLECII
ncbi:MAG: AAA family ATPase [Dysgonomonas sp.]|nr:AAA family ATPase [Dysgonomonas sp.]